MARKSAKNSVAVESSDVFSNDEALKLLESLEASIESSADDSAKTEQVSLSVDVVLNAIDELNSDNLPDAINNSIAKIRSWRENNKALGNKATLGQTRENVLVKAGEKISARKALEIAANGNQTMLGYIANPSNAKSLKRALEVADWMQGNTTPSKPIQHTIAGMKRASIALDSMQIAEATGNGGSVSAIRNVLRGFVWLGLASANQKTNCLVDNFRNVTFELTSEGKALISK